jgi:hypothetical protein
MSKSKILLKLDNLEKQYIKEYEYDNNRIMNDIEIMLRQKKYKNKKFKKIIEKNKIELEKVNLMSEYREQKQNERIKKILDRQKMFTNRINSLNKIKFLSRSTSLNDISKKSEEIIQKNNELDEEYREDLENYLLDKYQIHDQNHEEYIKKLKNKFENIERQRSARTDKYRNVKEQRFLEKEKNLIQKKINQLYEQKLNYDKIKEKRFKKNYKNQNHLKEIQERQEELYQIQQDKIKKYMKKLNYYGNLHKNNNKYIITEATNYSKRYNTLKKENDERLQNLNKEKYEYNKWYLLKQKDAFRWANDEDKEDERLRKISYQNILIEQKQIDERYEKLNKNLKKLEKLSLMKKDNEERLKIFYENNKNLKKKNYDDFMTLNTNASNAF